MTAVEQPIQPQPLTPTDMSEGQYISFRRRGVGRAGVALVLFAIVLGVSTFSILTGLTPISPKPNIIFGLLIANGAVLTVMILLIGWQVWRLMVAKRNKVPGTILHARIVAQFSLFAALPALVIASFATITLNRGLDTWFSNSTKTIIDTSLEIANSYIKEQRGLVLADVTGIAINLDQSKSLFEENRQLFLRQLATLVSLRNLSGAFVIDRKANKIEASITVHKNLGYRAPSKEDFAKAAKGELVIIGPGSGNVIRGLKKLNAYDDYYLYLYRLLNPTITSRAQKARIEKMRYDEMLSQRSGLQITFAMMYFGVAIIFLLAAVWLGMWFADRLVEPIVGLVRGARAVSRGELDTKVVVGQGTGDLATLGRAFNQMTFQLETQRSELIATNNQLDERRRFSEAVMSGVSSGEIGIGPDGNIKLANTSALKLLKRSKRELFGKNFAKVLPEMVPVLEQAESKVSGQAEAHITLKIEREDKSFVVQVTSERTTGQEHGVVVTFDDITELVSAQRNSAWADIARRIAHEIKNPLTPIQLAAERLNRKYQKEVSSNPEVFEKCTETIIRQVGDIRSMVDEFSSFARMPSALREVTDMAEVTRDALVLQKTSFEDVEFLTDIPDQKLDLLVDRRLVTQAITNLVKNAKEAIDARAERDPDLKAKISISLTPKDSEVVLTVTDNGIGLPKENRGRLTEPYMTTRTKGTGLGLAIVKRIMQDHDGRIELTDAPKDFENGQGAQVSLIFPVGLNPSAGDKNNKNKGQYHVS